LESGIILWVDNWQLLGEW